MKRIILTVFSLLLLLQISCGFDFKDEGLYAVIDTSMGDMVFKLDYDKTPVTVGNFVGLAEGTREFKDARTSQSLKKPFYDGIIFHRIIKGFMIQGGCPLGIGTGGPGYSFIDEIVPDLKHDSAGILSMANSGPGTNGSQFFITLKPTPHLNGRHTVFGHQVHGHGVREDIGEVKTASRDKPVDDVVIDTIKIIRVGENAKNFNAEKAFAKNEEEMEQQKKEDEENLKGFLKTLRVKENKIVTTDSGLKYYIKKTGKGTKPKSGDTIVAHYTGWLTDGTKFDSSRDIGKPFETPIGVRRVIAGWDEAFQQMRRGGRRVLIIPFNLAYGARGRPPKIPPRATLIFDVELLKIKKKK